MTLLKRYVLRLFISLKYITANVVDRNNGRIVATASTVEHSLKSTLECGRSCNAKAASVVGEVLAMRLRVEGLEQGQGRGIHVDVTKEIEKKGFKNQTKVWAVVNALKNNGVKLILEDDEERVGGPTGFRNREGED
ncbi:50S ribosomal protein l18 [Phtheirospermum japonicum]|uniref:50S ribosomal protein l18 n=1 Tax=Phtheirospermum japonicum TaxID=374723 RepID=A0A830CHN6_9LAMI|nr:50S ribosomal protein l18 [Phtheirospermum japonicum]